MDAALGAFSGVLRILQSGVSSNWWGLACPSHCGPPSFGLLLSAFLLGFILCLGCLASLALWFLWGLPLSLSHLLLRQPQLHGLLAIWMVQPEPDSDIVELSVQLAGLSITVRGSLLVLQTLSVTLLSHLLAPATLVWSLLWLLNHLCCPGLRRQLLLLNPALRFWLLSLLVLVTGSWCHIDSPVHDYLGHRGFAEPGLLVAGHELCVREGLDHRIRLRQSNYPIDSGAWCIVSASLNPGSFRHLVPSLLQLAEYKDLLPFATASLQRPRRGATLRLRGDLPLDAQLITMAEILPVTDRFLPYVLEMVMSDAEEDGKSLAVILVVCKEDLRSFAGGSCKTTSTRRFWRVVRMQVRTS